MARSSFARRCCGGVFSFSGDGEVEDSFWNKFFTPRVLFITLVAINLINYADRGAMAAVLDSVSRDFDLSDVQAGALGSAFMVGYMIAAPAFAQLSQAYLPTKLMFSGLFLWLGATALCWWSPTYTVLLIGRVLGGVGEASFAGLSPAVIDDNAPPASRTLWLGMFFSMIPFGGAVGYIIGGVFAEDFDWRLTFFTLLTAMSLLITLVLLMPKRVSEGAMAKTKASDERAELLAGEDIVGSPMIAAKPRTFGENVNVLAKNPIFVLNVLGSSAYTFVVGAIAFWIPAYLLRSYPEFEGHPKTPTLLVGVTTVVAGFCGTASGGIIIDAMGGSKNPRGAARATLYSAFVISVAVPLLLFALFSPSVTMFFVFIAIAELFLFSSTAPINGAIMTTVDASSRSFAMSLCLFFQHLIGDFPSPVIVGWINDLASPLASMVFLVLWLLWATLFWTLSWRITKRKAIVEETNSLWTPPKEEILKNRYSGRETI